VITKEVPIEDLRPAKDQVRVTFDEESMEELARSIKEEGVNVPIKVRPNGRGYEIVYGHRRTEASKRAGLKKIPAIIEDLTDDEAFMKQVMENECRKEAPPLEKAAGYKKLMDAVGCNRQELARMLGISLATVNRALLTLEGWEHGVVVRSVPSVGPSTSKKGNGQVSIPKTALVMRGGGSWEERRKLAKKIEVEQLTQRETEEVIAAHNKTSDKAEKRRVLKTTHPKRRDFSFEQELTRVRSDEAYKKSKKRKAELTEDPVVKNYTTAITEYLKAIEQAKESSIRFAPESINFIVGRHNLVKQKTTQLEEALSNV
jgi:ParB family chromosome partitioning protein